MIRELAFGFLLICSAVAKHGHSRTRKQIRLAEVPAAQDTVNPLPTAQGPDKKWLTLNGKQPLVVAQGGFPGLFPDSSEIGYSAAGATGVPDIVRYCNLQLTKDNLGVCLAELKLDNCTDAATKFPKLQRKYDVNGREIDGWFPIDFAIDQMMKEIRLMQNIFSRASIFDFVFPPMQPDGVFGMQPKLRLWLNVENDAFWSQHKLSAVRYIEESTQFFVADYISSPEIGFLKAMGASKTFDKAATKLVFRFLGPADVEPTTKERYDAWLRKLGTIKTFASGILVHKDYVWPVGKDGYLRPATALVEDAHKEGLEVYAYGFASDVFTSYNYSYDPAAEYLQFVDNSRFSVDGVVTEFPGSASNAIACLAQYPNPTKKFARALIISHNGASIDYPGCTDLAYRKAVEDGADVIDCNVQMTKDGVAFCLDSPDLLGKTTAATALMDRSTSVPDIQKKNGIFSFDVTWSEIKSLKPLITNPYQTSGFQRNPKSKNAGKLMTLPEFLEFAKKNANTGILIGIQNAAYLASRKGLNVVETVTRALKNAALDPKQQLLVQSDDTSVLAKFKDAAQRVLLLKEIVGDVPRPVAEDVKRYADAVNVGKKSIVLENKMYLSTKATKVVEEMHAMNVSVYASGFSTETQSMLLDFYSDPYTELATYVSNGVDGVVTDNPKVANAFMKNPCVDQNNMALPFVFLPVKAGDYVGQVDPGVLPAEAPVPALQGADVVSPPLPPVNTSATAKDKSNSPGGGGGGGPPSESSRSRIAADGRVAVAMGLWLMGLLWMIGC